VNPAELLEHRALDLGIFLRDLPSFLIVRGFGCLADLVECLVCGFDLPYDGVTLRSLPLNSPSRSNARPDPDLTEDREAVAAAVRGASSTELPNRHHRTSARCRMLSTGNLGPPHSGDCAQGNEAEYGQSAHEPAGITPLTKRLSVSDSSQLHGDRNARTPVGVVIRCRVLLQIRKRKAAVES
jgi:hypothetical protein